MAIAVRSERRAPVYRGERFSKGWVKCVYACAALRGQKRFDRFLRVALALPDYVSLPLSLPSPYAAIFMLPFLRETGKYKFSPGNILETDCLRVSSDLLLFHVRFPPESSEGSMDSTCCKNRYSREEKEQNSSSTASGLFADREIEFREIDYALDRLAID